MSALTTKIGIINRALQLLGNQSISSLTENSRGAKSMMRAYDSVMLAELRSNTWTFSIKRANIDADPTAPIFGKARYYPLPGDWLFTAPEESDLRDPRRRDWQIEGRNIVSNDSPPLSLRYVSSNLTESDFDVLFAEGLSHSLAIATCEEITNSNTKKAELRDSYKEIMGMARKRNAVEQPPVMSPTCSFITVRA